jgi:hypothetical protein
VSVKADEDELRDYAVLAESREQAKGIALEKAEGLLEADAVIMEGFDPETDSDYYDDVIA